MNQWFHIFWKILFIVWPVDYTCQAPKQKYFFKYSILGNKNLMKINKKCEVLHLGRSSPRHQYLLGATLLESSSAEKDLVVLLDTRLNTSQQCALAVKDANGIFSCIRQSIAYCWQVKRGDPSALLSIVEGAPGHLSVSNSIPTHPPLQYKQDLDKLGRVQQRASKIKMIKRL